MALEPTKTSTADATETGLLADLRRLWAHQTAAGTSTGRGAGTGTPDGSTLATRDGTGAGTGTPTAGITAGSTAPAARITAAELLAARKPRRCLNHTDPAEYLDEPARNRPGYLRTVCRRCGCFLGYRPAEPEKWRRTGKAS
jgi:hypothetical protein